MSITQALNGLMEGPVWRIIVWISPEISSFGAQNDAAECPALTVDMLGGRIHHQVGAKRERMLPDGGGEHIVHHQHGAMRVGDLGNSGDIDQIEGRVGRRFEKDKSGVWAHGLFEGIKVAPVDKRRVDAPAR